MRWAILLILVTPIAACAISNSASQPTGSPTLANNKAGLYIGASAGASVGGGPLGAGTDDNPAGAK